MRNVKTKNSEIFLVQTTLFFASQIPILDQIKGFWRPFDCTLCRCGLDWRHSQNQAQEGWSRPLGNKIFLNAQMGLRYNQYTCLKPLEQSKSKLMSKWPKSIFSFLPHFSLFSCFFSKISQKIRKNWENGKVLKLR